MKRFGRRGGDASTSCSGNAIGLTTQRFRPVGLAQIYLRTREDRSGAMPLWETSALSLTSWKEGHRVEAHFPLSHCCVYRTAIIADTPTADCNTQSTVRSDSCCTLAFCTGCTQIATSIQRASLWTDLIHLFVKSITPEVHHTKNARLAH